MELDFDKTGGLVPAIIQDAETGKVLMLAYMNRTAWEKTLETGKAWFYSRSRDKQWMKGEESGNVQNVKEIFVDCDEDTVLLKVEQVGKAHCARPRLAVDELSHDRRGHRQRDRDVEVM